MRVKIEETSYEFGSNLENLDLLKISNPDWDIEKILNTTGINNRHCSTDAETALDLAVEAAKKLKMQVDDVDLLLFVTQSPEYILPTTACIAQDRLGLNKNIAAFDINLGCSGYVYALSVAGSMMESNQCSKALILCGDTYTKYISINDRTSRPLFSDAGSATILTKSKNDNKIGPFIYGTDGSGADNLIVRNSASKKESTKTKDLYMNGAEVLLFTMANVPNGVSQLLNKASISFEDIDYFLFHQASKVVMNNITRKLNIDEKKFLTNYQQHGNTVSCTIPILLKQKIDAGIVNRGNKLMLFGFGVGYSYGACVIDY
ncbi:ketoacyl-ACP synthase III [Gammaproteobacteria bacterium]|jgi:3-oxoacyl-[acyl-carrier-protein] synthase III|nr:ketoacyl-ACP synthase III [Gammaproteobacteria bacterium]